MAELEVDAQDVVRLMLQFCKENGLKDRREVIFGVILDLDA